MNRAFLGAMALFGMTLAGCGGGSGSGGNGLIGNGGAEQTMNFGSLTTRVAGTVQPPVTAGGSGALVTGVAGGTISSIQLHDAMPNLAETRISFQRIPYALYTTAPDGTNLLQFPGITNYYSKAVWSPDGTQIAYNQGIGSAPLILINADGSGAHTFSGSFHDYNPSWSFDGSQIAFTRNTTGFNTGAQIFKMSATGTGITNLSNDVTFSDEYASWYPLIGFNQLVFEHIKAGSAQIFRMAGDGSGKTNLSGANTDDHRPSYSPNGNLIVFVTGGKIATMDQGGGNRTVISTPAAGQSDNSPAWSPDGTQIVFQRVITGLGQIWVMNLDGSNQHALFKNSDASDAVPSWSPFFHNRTLIGLNGAFGANASGFLVGQQDDRITSLVVFDSPATLRTTARVAAQTGLGQSLPNIVFSINADSLSLLGYINGENGPKITVLPAGGLTSATGALVTFSASKGTVVSVLPYTSDRAAGGAASVRVENGVQVCRGHFLGVWNARGQNIAPRGAAEVRIDGRTGDLLSVR